MINDATALVAYRVALVAAVEGTFSAGDALLDFAVSAAGGVAIGLAVAWIGTQVIRRQTDVALSIFVTLLVAYGSYIAAEELGTSGVLATVAAGIYSGWNAHSYMDGGTRLSGIAFWGVMVFGLEALLFVLLGLQAPQLADELDIGALALQALAVALTVVAVRMAWAAIPAGGLGDERARADRRRLGGDARRDLARRGARGADRGRRAPGDPAAHLRRDRGDAARAGADPRAAAAAAGAAGREPVLPRRGDGPARGGAGRARPARRARGGGRRRGAAAAPARALPHALRDLRRRARRRRRAARGRARWSCASTARCGAS